MEIAYYFDKAGVGLNQRELTLLSLSIKSLINIQPVQNAKFWGKIFGLVQNYYIVETAFAEGEDTEEEENVDANENESPEDENEELNEGQDVLPKSKWIPPIKIPREQNHTGTNKKVYFVINEPGLRWIRLPPVTPEQIVAARTIQHMFTGILDLPVLCYPPFPGTEANYLRAQIARISASTQISPEGYYDFGDDDEEEEELDGEEEGERQRYVKNEEYEPLSVSELADPSLEHWVHHTSYILPQGRVQWWNPGKNLIDEFDDFDDENEEENDDEATRRKTQFQPEHGPPILTSIATDLALFGQKPWTIKISSNFLTEYAVTVVSANLWPGAHTIAWGKNFENIYIGWGLKSVGPGFQPQLQPIQMGEYQQIGNELEETVDPTPEEEASLRPAPEEDDDEQNEEEDEQNEEEQDDEGDEEDD